MALKPGLQLDCHSFECKTSFMAVKLVLKVINCVYQAGIKVFLLKNLYINCKTGFRGIKLVLQVVNCLSG